MALQDMRVPRLDIVLPRSADGSSFAMYRAASASDVAVTLPDGADPRDFFIDGATWQLPGASLSRIRSCAQRMSRGAAEIAAAAAPTVSLNLIVAGEGAITEGGRTLPFGAGDVLVQDSRRPYESRVGAFEVRLLIVPQERVPAALLPPEGEALRLPAGAAGTRLLAAAMLALAEEMDGLDAAEADGAVTALCGLAAGTVAAHLARQDAERRRGTDPLLEAGLAYVERRWSEAALTPEAVGAHLGLSRSALYRLFAPQGGIGAVIRQRRLDHAMRALLVGGEPAVPLEAFAARHGFRGETHLARAFQARFGATPLQVHAKVAGADRAWLAAQAGRAGFGSLQAWLDALASGAPGPDRGPA